MSERRFNHPGQDGSMDLGFGPDPVRPPAPRATGSSVTLSAEQFQALLDRAAPAPAPVDYTSQIGEPVRFQVEEPENYVDPIVALIQNLPDPSQNFDGFKRELGGVLAQGRDMILNQAQGTATQVSAVNRSFDDAWKDFQDRYSDLAPYDDLVADASRREFDDLRARGFDPNHVVSANMEGFVDSIASRVRNTVNRVRGYTDSSNPSEDPNDWSRSEMVDGGSPGRRLPPGKDTRADVPTSLVDDIRRVQRELGIY